MANIGHNSENMIDEYDIGDLKETCSPQTVQRNASVVTR